MKSCVIATKVYIIACKDWKDVEHVIDFLNKAYTKANVYDGSDFDYLGILFTLKSNGQVTIDSSMVTEFLKEHKVHDEARARTLAAIHLFNINSKADSLCDAKRKKFHLLVAKGLYIAKRARKDYI
jgi:hypothetical protein